MGFGFTAAQLIAAPVGFFVGVGGTAVVSLLQISGRPRPRKPKCIVITGATMGIGEALALSYSESGVTLALTGRNKKLLETVGEACRKRGRSRAQSTSLSAGGARRGASVRLGNVDVTDRQGMERFLFAVDRDAPVDLVIANAGVSESTCGLKHDLAAATRKLFAVNVDGVFNTLLPLLPRMQERGSGQIAIMSSLAGTVGIPGWPAYSGTKCAVRAYGEALRGAVYDQGVFVNVICPGFITSPMTNANEGHSMPFKWEMEPSVKLIKSALARDEPVLNFPGLFSAAVWALGWAVPTWVKHEMMRTRLPPYNVTGFCYPRPSKPEKSESAGAARAASAVGHVPLPTPSARESGGRAEAGGKAREAAAAATTTKVAARAAEGEGDEEEGVLVRVSEVGFKSSTGHTHTNHYPRRHHRHHNGR